MTEVVRLLREIKYPRATEAARELTDYARGARPTADVNWADISDPRAERRYLWRHYVEYETMWPVGGPLFLARDDLPRYFEWLFNNLAERVRALGSRASVVECGTPVPLSKDVGCRRNG